MTETEPRAEAADAGRLPNHVASEELVRASEVSYRRLFEAARDGIFILDAETGRIHDVNPFLVELLGFSRNEMIGKTVGELSPFKDIEPNRVMLERLQKVGYVRYENLPLETRDGRYVPVEFVSNVYRAGDHDVIQCNIRDITQQKQAEEQIHRLNAELEHGATAGGESGTGSVQLFRLPRFAGAIVRGQGLGGTDATRRRNVIFGQQSEPAGEDFQVGESHGKFD